jgi:hypothetical protein
LRAFQTDLGVPATGALDAATLAAAQEALAQLTSPATTEAPDTTETTSEADEPANDTTGTSTG